MASFAPLQNLGSALTGGKAGQLIKPPKAPGGIAAAGTGLLAGLAPKAPAPIKGVAKAGSALTTPTLASTLAGAPSAGGGTSATAAATGNGDTTDLDSTAMQNIANYLFKTNNSINADQVKQGNDVTSLQSALGTLNYDQPRDELALEQSANAGGGLYSSVYNQNLGNENQKFLTEQNADTTKYNNDIQSLASTIANLQAGIPLYNADQAAASATRAATAAQKNPSLSAPSTAAITTHPGGAFYNYVKAVTGKAPAGSVSTSDPLYLAWQAGTPPSYAKLLGG